MRDHDPGDSQAPEGCPGPIAPCDQTVVCLLCGIALWGDREDIFEAIHPGPWTLAGAIAGPLGEEPVFWAAAPGRERATMLVVAQLDRGYTFQAIG